MVSGEIYIRYFVDDLDLFGWCISYPAILGIIMAGLYR